MVNCWVGDVAAVGDVSASEANCAKLYSAMVLKPCNEPAATWGGSGGLWAEPIAKFCMLFDKSPSKDDCMEAGSEMGLLVVTEAAAPQPFVKPFTIAL